MVYTCFLCKWRSDKLPRRSYHKFPSNTELKQKWLDICGKSDVSVGERTSLCNVHFEESCFRYGLVMGRKILKEGSIPTLHLTRAGTAKSPIQLVDKIRPNESQNEESLTTLQPMIDPTLDSNCLTCVKDLTSQLETGNTLIEIPVEFCPPKESSVKRTHSKSDEDQKKVPSQEQEYIECRVCLQKYNHQARLLYIFQPWETQWDGMGDSIAQDLSQIANINITSTDQFSKLICQFCHQRLLEACSFVVNVRINDKLLRQRVETLHKQESLSTEPIQDNKIKSDTFNINMDIEVKQEAMSDDEGYDNGTNKSFKDGCKGIERPNLFNDWEIKVEHEENKQPPIIQTTVYGSTTQNEFEADSILLIGDCKRPRIEPETEQSEKHSKGNQSVMVYRCSGSVGPPVKASLELTPEIGAQHEQAQPHHHIPHHQQRNQQVL